MSMEQIQAVVLREDKKIKKFVYTNANAYVCTNHEEVQSREGHHVDRQFS